MILYEKERSARDNYIYNQEDTNLNFGLHLHNSFEFICAIDGEIMINVDKCDFLIKKGQAALILPNQIHSYTTTEHSQTYLCVFSNNFVGEFYKKIADKNSQNPIFNFNNYAVINDFKNNACNHYLIKSHFYYLINLYDEKADYVLRNKKYYDITAKIIHYVENNYKEKADMKTLAMALGYEYHYLSVLISDNLNINYTKLVNGYRISHAQYLLKNTQKTVTEIASLCGYDSLRSFNRNFKQITGLAPVNFR